MIKRYTEIEIIRAMAAFIASGYKALTERQRQIVDTRLR